MLTIWGNMTIKDVTRTISIPAQIDLSEKNHRKATAKFTFDRFAWNIGRERSWLERKLVDKEIELTIEIITE
jgi:polyisoprenoid-binding protein YceI